tara:strand:+ start:87 stop:284 length:198 start_codon:yes stop_codon:yes gene_type:complete
MSNQILISLVIPIKIIIIYFIYLYFRKKKLREKDRSAQMIERMQIREYGRKINEKTRNKNISRTL